MNKKIILFILSNILIGNFLISQVSTKPSRVKVGEYTYKTYETPHPYPAGNESGKLVHQDIIIHPQASYIVVHFEKFELADNDFVVITDPKETVKHIYKNKGFLNKGKFFSLSIQGDIAVIKLYSFQDKPKAYGYKVDFYAHGFPQWQLPIPLFPSTGVESICGAVDYLDAICYAGSEPIVYERSKAAVKLLYSGSDLCSGWLVSCENHILTNNHCFESQGELDNIEFQFMYQRPNCGSGTAVPDLQLQGGTFLRTNANYDYTLSIPNLNGSDPQSVYGYIRLDPRIPDLQEQIYIVGHPQGYPKKISYASDQAPDTGGVCRVQSVSEASCWGSGPDIGYYCDTEPGSSGSVVLSAVSHKAIALHHCGGCLNSGVPILDVYNDIQSSSTPLPPCSISDLPEIRYIESTINDSCTYGGPGNADGIIDPGENITLIVSLKNIGVQTATGVYATLSTSTPGITINVNTATFPDIPSNAIVTSDPPHFNFNVSPSIDCGTTIDFTLDISYNEGTKTETFQLKVGNTINNDVILLSEDFTGTGGWPGAWTVIDGGTSSDTWTDSNPGNRNANAPIQEPFVIADSDFAGTSAIMDEQLITPIIDFSNYASAQLEFDHYFRWYSGGLDEIGDVDVKSYLTGGNWVNKFRQQGSSSPNPEHLIVDITSEAAGASDVQVRWHYYNAQYEWYWIVDNVKIMAPIPPSCQSHNCISAAFLKSNKPAIDDTSSPTANEIIETNELVGLIGNLENIGTELASNVSGSLTTTDPIIINNGIATYPDINVNENQNCITCYSITAPSANRPSMHWDINVSESPTCSNCSNGTYTFSYHIGNSFLDVSPFNIFYKFIEILLHNQIIGGCNASQYCPAKNVQRQQLAKFLCNTMNKTGPGSCILSSCTNIFQDVPTSNPFCNYIEALYNINIISGCQTSPAKFCPDNFAERQAMAKFVCLAMQALNPNSCLTTACSGIFSDVPSNNPFCPYIESLYSNNIINGCSSNMYCPTQYVSREQLAKFLVNGFNLSL